MRTYYNEESEKKLILQAMRLAKGEVGYEAMEIVADFFDSEGHPHAQYTFERAAMDRYMSEDNTNIAARYLAHEMSYLVVVNRDQVKWKEEEEDEAAEAAREAEENE